MVSEKEFSQRVREKLCNDVGGKCSKPDCRVPTKGGGGSIGKAAHITAASKGGPRYDHNLSDKERHSEANGIWLCGNHHDVVDKFPEQYPVEILKVWKEQAIEAARREMITGCLDISLLSRVELQLTCKTLDPHNDIYLIEAKLVNKGDRCFKLVVPYSSEIIVFMKEPRKITGSKEQLINPGDSIILSMVDIEYIWGKHNPNLKITAKFFCSDEKPLEITRSLHELFEEAERLQRERYEKSLQYQPSSRWREPLASYKVPTPWETR